MPNDPIHTEPQKLVAPGAPDAGRRAALAKLGLAAAAIYAAPAITRLDQAKAAIPSHHCAPQNTGCK